MCLSKFSPVKNWWRRLRKEEHTKKNTRWRTCEEERAKKKSVCIKTPKKKNFFVFCILLQAFHFARSSLHILLHTFSLCTLLSAYFFLCSFCTFLSSRSSSFWVFFFTWSSFFAHQFPLQKQIFFKKDPIESPVGSNLRSEIKSMIGNRQQIL